MKSEWYILLSENDWLIYGLVIILLLPILIIAINELLYRLKSNEHSLSPPIKLIRNIILPLIATLVIFTQVIGYSRGTIPVKIVETFIWILVINTLLAILNVLFFKSSSSSFAKANVPQLFLDIFRIAMVLLGAAIVLSSVWGVDLGAMMTALGLGSFVLGLALQDTLGNLFSGIALVYEKPFKEGDVITVGEHTGRVVEMNWRAIRLLTREEVLVVIPHLVIGQETVQNLSEPQEAHIIKTMVGFSYSTPPNLVKKIMMECCLATDGILNDPIPEVKTSEFADSKIDYELEFAIPEYMQFEEILDDLMTRVWYAAKRNNLNIPFPQMVLHQSDIQNNASPDLLTSFLTELPSHLPIKPSESKSLSKHCEIEYYGTGEYVISEGDQTGTIYIIVKGIATIVPHKSKGADLPYLELVKGDFFGEISLFTQMQNIYSVRCDEDLIVLSIPPGVAVSLVENNQRLAHYFDDIMDKRRLMVAGE